MPTWYENMTLPHFDCWDDKNFQWWNNVYAKRPSAIENTDDRTKRDCEIVYVQDPNGKKLNYATDYYRAFSIRLCI